MYYSPYSLMYGGSYLIFAIIPALISLWAQAKIRNTYSTYSSVRNSANLTGAEVARRMLDAHGLTDVRIEQVGGTLSDHYDPSKKVLRLSSGVYGTPSVAAMGVACHECGHAYQHAEGYGALSLRTAMVPVVNFGGRIGPTMLMVGLCLVGVLGADLGYGIAKIGLIIFSLTAVFSLVTLPVEFNASNRAKAYLWDAGLVRGEEGNGVAKVLSSAALTYVAGAIQSVATVLYYALQLFGRSGRRNDRR